MKTVKHLIYLLTIIAMVSCSSITRITSVKMDQIELGMTKNQVTEILGSTYTIAEKRMEGNVSIEIVSYSDFYKDYEYYMFVFKDGKLEKWYRELVDKRESSK